MSDGSGFRYCPKCGEYKDPTAFYEDSAPRPCGRGPLRRKKCRACLRAQMRKRYEHRSQMVDEYKLARGCVDCGWRGHPRALEFDHLPGSEKLHNISGMIANTTWSLDDIKAEMAKCEVVCANCHRIRTYTRECANTDWDLRQSSCVVRIDKSLSRPEQLTLEV